MAFQRVPHILYIEDEKGLARILQKKLQKCGFTVDIAPNGKEGLIMLDTGRYNILIVDCNLPDFGLDIIRSLAARESSPPSIIVIGEGNELVAVEAMKLGATDYLIKDVNRRYLELLPAVIEQALQKQ
jgi:DNA-binding response OmpR family regulator